jgi:outer membrane lipoprotein-sorting protein
MKTLLFFCCLLTGWAAKAQTPDELVKKLKAKYDLVNDYEAAAKLKTNVVFIKAPVAKIKIYYKRPNKMKIKNESGISFIPKGSVNVNMGNIFGMTNYTALDAGTETLNGVVVKIIKILPSDETSDIVLSTLYIDEKQLLVMKSKTTTRDNGTYELTMKYGAYAAYGLPDKVEFAFNTKDYKLPKGVTVDYDNGTAEQDKAKLKNKKGKVEIIYTSYTINKGVSDDVFK